MPTYCYRVMKTKEVVERVYRIGRAPRKIHVNGLIAYRDIEAEHIGTTPAGNWPLLSDAAGVNPEQIPEAKADLERKGVPTDFTPDGRCVFRSRGHRRDVLKAIGMIDRSGGYGDG